MASSGQFFSQILHAVHAIAQTCLARLPRSWFMQATSTSWLLGTMEMSPLGQAATHFLHDLHFTRSTTARPSAFTWMASKGHARSQLPLPKQPHAQAFAPPNMR